MIDIDIIVQRGGFKRSIRIHELARVVALVGASGSGKTTVLHAVSGLLRPLRGHIAVGGRTLFDRDLKIDLPVRDRRIGYVFQDARLFPHLDVRGNLCYGYRAGVPGSNFRFDDVVQLLGIEALLARRPKNLSGGEIQRVAIGRALLSQPEILLLDEPLSALDQARREELIPYLQRLRNEVNLPMIYVSHVASEVQRIADTLHVIS